jgi:hypothetical protein
VHRTQAFTFYAYDRHARGSGRRRVCQRADVPMRAATRTACLRSVCLRPRRRWRPECTAPAFATAPQCAPQFVPRLALLLRTTDMHGCVLGCARAAAGAVRWSSCRQPFSTRSRAWRPALAEPRDDRCTKSVKVCCWLPFRSPVVCAACVLGSVIPSDVTGRGRPATETGERTLVEAPLHSAAILRQDSTQEVNSRPPPASGTALRRRGRSSEAQKWYPTESQKSQYFLRSSNCSADDEMGVVNW